MFLKHISSQQAGVFMFVIETLSRPYKRKEIPVMITDSTIAQTSNIHSYAHVNAFDLIQDEHQSIQAVLRLCRHTNITDIYLEGREKKT